MTDLAWIAGAAIGFFVIGEKVSSAINGLLGSFSGTAAEQGLAEVYSHPMGLDESDFSRSSYYTRNADERHTFALPWAGDE